VKEYQIYCMHWILHLEYRIYNLGYNRHISIVNHINRNLFILFCDLGCIHTNCINGNSDPVFGIQILSIGTWILFGIQITSIGCWIIFWDTNYVIAMGTWILFWDTNYVNRKLDPFWDTNYVNRNLDPFLGYKLRQ